MIPAGPTPSIDHLNSLLRGELEAVENYDRSLELFEKFPAALTELRRIRDDHRSAVYVLRQQIESKRGTPVESSGTWGTVAAVVTRAAKLIGPDTTLADLELGEAQRIAHYSETLKQPVPPACQNLIAETLIRRCESHLSRLEKVRTFLK